MKKIYLVSCVKSRLSHSAPARELYSSVWFKAVRRYVGSRAGAEWFILSAQYGLLKPEKIVDPYENTMNRMTVGERRRWAKMTARQIGESVRPQQDIGFLAGANYRDFLLPLLLERGFGCTAPLAHFGIGSQVSWLQRNATAKI